MAKPPIQDKFLTRVVPSCTIYDAGNVGISGADVAFQIAMPGRYSVMVTTPIGGFATSVDDNPGIAVTPYTFDMPSSIAPRKEDGLLTVTKLGLGKVKIRANWNWELKDYPGETNQRWNATFSVTQVYMEAA